MELTDEIVIDRLDEKEVKFGTILYIRLTMLTSVAVFTMHQSVPLENEC